LQITFFMKCGLFTDFFVYLNLLIFWCKFKQCLWTIYTLWLFFNIIPLLFSEQCSKSSKPQRNGSCRGSKSSVNSKRFLITQPRLQCVRNPSASKYSPVRIAWPHCSLAPLHRKRATCFAGTWHALQQWLPNLVIWVRNASPQAWVFGPSWWCCLGMD